MQTQTVAVPAWFVLSLSGGSFELEGRHEEGCALPGRLGERERGFFVIAQSDGGVRST
ncbi:MAG: hypothetical protein KDB38_08740 [Nocardioidaceae bacterium]|nr:hypothetical protein [Nocardioidaceae bacterium]